jgi:PhzF family phenazine biosynthesis protein
MTHMVETGILNWNNADLITIELHTPTTTAQVEISRLDNHRTLVMLDIQPPEFQHPQINPEKLATLLGLHPDDYNPAWPLEIATGDFTHLVVPVKGLSEIRRISPDFSGLTDFCNQNGLQTIAVFSHQTEHADHTLHVRDFCPAVGVAESAAAGTTNAALTSYAIRHNIVSHHNKTKIIVLAEQGCEINRPSSIRSEVTMKHRSIHRLQVGGVATKIMDGQLYLPK